MSVHVILRVLLVASVAVGVTLTLSRNLREAPAKPIHRSEPATDQDTNLRAAAATALGEREGSIIVIDPQTGRIRAVVNPDLAFKSAFPPGSTIKPFSTIAALRAACAAWRDLRMPYEVARTRYQLGLAYRAVADNDERGEAQVLVRASLMATFHPARTRVVRS